MTSKKRISIIGATGNLGVPVVLNLLSFGFETKLIVRDKVKAQKLFGSKSNIEIIEADLEDVNALTKALSDTDYLYLNLSSNTTKLDIPFATEREGVANILAAVNRETIKQIVAISGLGAFQNVHKPNGFEFVPNTIRKQGHKMIKESGIPYTFLHCSWFADSFIIYRRKNNYSIIGDTKSPIYFTNCFNYSIHLANAIGNPNAYFKEFPIQGREGITHPEAAKFFLNIYSPTTNVANLPHNLIKVLALFIKDMRFVKHMSEYFATSTEEFLAEECDTYKILGEPKLSLTEYADKVKREETYKHLEQ